MRLDNTLDKIIDQSVTRRVLAPGLRAYVSASKGFAKARMKMAKLKFKAIPKADGNSKAKPKAPTETKIGKMLALLRRPEGAEIKALMDATGWQAHSVRGALSGTVKKALKLELASEKAEGRRVYRIVDPANA